MAKSKQIKEYNPELTELESQYQQYVKSKYKGNLQSKMLALTAVIVSIIAIILIVFSVHFYFNLQTRDSQINNVTIGDISLQGLTVEEATALLNAHKDTLTPKNDILVKIADEIFVLSMADSKAYLNISAIVDAAYVYGRDSKDGETLLQLDPQDFMVMDSASVRSWLKKNIQNYNGIPEETTVTVTGERPDLTQKPVSGEPNQILSIKMGTPKKYCPPEPLFKRILNAYINRTYEIIAEIEVIEPETVTAQSIFNKYCVRPVNATLNPETLVITESIDGYGFDIQAVQALLEAAAWGEELPPIPLSRITPKITSDSLNAELY